MVFIIVEPKLLKAQDFDACLRSASDYLYRQGVSNYIFYDEPRHVELLDTKQTLIPSIDYQHGGVDLREYNLCAK